MENNLKYYQQFALTVGTLTNADDYKENNGLLEFVKEERRYMFIKFVTIGCRIEKAAYMTNTVYEVAKEFGLTPDQVFETVIKQIK